MADNYNHVFIGGRCYYCNINDLDADAYGPELCEVEDRVAMWSFGPEQDTAKNLLDERFPVVNWDFLLEETDEKKDGNNG